MTLSQALGFFEQSADKLANARSRLDKANTTIAERILDNYRGSVKVGDYTIHKVVRTSNSGFSASFLFVTFGKYDELYGQPDTHGAHGAVDLDHSYYFAGDFNCWVEAADRKTKIWFAQNIKKILQAFAEKYSTAADLNNSAAEMVEAS